jgi:hypothetical protein
MGRSAPSFTRPVADQSAAVSVPPISFSMDLLLIADEHVLRRDVANLQHGEGSKFWITQLSAN